MDDHDSIIKQTKDFLIAYKQAGQLSQASDKGEKGLDYELVKALKCKLHLLTRLDRPVSGMVIFSKTASFNKHFQRKQENGRVEKDYITIVEGKLGRPSDIQTTLSHFHVHDKKHLKARLSDTQTASFKPISLSYETIAVLDNYTILKVTLTNGRFHQIRAQLSHIGHPIKGDVKYGARRGNKDRSIHLHAYRIRFKNAMGDKRQFEAPLPDHDALWQAAVENIASEE